MNDSKRSRIDTWLSQLRNHRIGAAIILMAMVVIGIGTLTDALDKILSFARQFETEKELQPEELKQIRSEIEKEFPERLLNSLVRNTHSKDLFPDEIREVLASEFDRQSSIDFKRSLFKANETLRKNFKAACLKLTNFIFDGYGEKYGLNGDGEAVVKAADIRAELRPHIAKQASTVIMWAFEIVEQKD